MSNLPAVNPIYYGLMQNNFLDLFNFLLKFNAL